MVLNGSHPRKSLDQGPSRSVLILLVVMGLFWATVAGLLPITQDEAYYALWGQHLALGYFDHPPLVALLTIGQHLSSAPFASPWLYIRLGTVAAALVHLWMAYRLYCLWSGGTNSPGVWLALLVLGTNLMGLLHGVLTTPDTLVLLFWTLALFEATQAFVQNPKRWLSAGFWVGCGLWSKYTMSLIGLVFLIPLVRQFLNHPQRLSKGTDPKPALLTVWPYLGGMICFLVFSPHLWWNAQNDWITFRFQLRHGFSMERAELLDQTKSNFYLPPPQVPHALDREALLSKPFLKAREIEYAKNWWDEPLDQLNRALGFYTSQITLWGAWLVLACVGFWRSKKPRFKFDAVYPVESLTTRILIHSSVWVPLIFFGMLSPFSKVEANWSAMYIVGAAYLWVPFVLPASTTRGLIAAAANMLLVGLLVAHARFPFLPLKGDRILRETYGYQALGMTLAELPGPVFVESYQLFSMIKFYQPQLLLRQWPGLTRDSEATRNPVYFERTQDDMSKAGGFWLLINQLPAPKIIPYQALSLSLLRDCKSTKLQVITDPRVANSGGSDWTNSLCPKPVRTLYLVQYGR